VRRTTDGVEVETASGGRDRFDHVVLACHSDQALGMLVDPTRAETDVLGAIHYQPNEVVLHTDEQLLPANRKAWASWNSHVLAHNPGRATVTYWMNNLHQFESSTQVLISLNRTSAIDPEKILRSFQYSHPVFDRTAIEAQTRRSTIQGVDRIWFAGAYWGHGFHEDGVRSALDLLDVFRPLIDRRVRVASAVEAIPTAA
jgi:predicted NAD/FAD-binding protein